MAYQFAFQGLEELLLRQMPGCLEPCFHSSDSYPLFRRCRPTLCTDNTFAVFVPVKLKPKKRKCSATLPARVKSAESYDLRLARFNFKVKPAKSFRKNLIESSRIISELKGTHPIICVSAHDRTALHSWFHHFLKPFIQHRVKVQVRQYG